MRAFFMAPLPYRQAAACGCFFGGFLHLRISGGRVWKQNSRLAASLGCV